MGEILTICVEPPHLKRKKRVSLLAVKADCMAVTVAGTQTIF